MAKFLDGAGVQAALTDIIKSANSDLYIIAPYLKIATQTKNYIKNVDKKNINFHLISRKDAELKDEEIQFLNELNSAKILICENLHAKCYLNEKEGLITSMNLHEYSQTHNWEMGIKFSKTEDPEIYNAAVNEITVIRDSSKQDPRIKRIHYEQKGIDPIRKTMPQKTVHKPKVAPNKGIFDKVLDSVLGEAAYCIRCGKHMEHYNIEKPLCDACYLKWAQHKNPKYPERFCHACKAETPKGSITYEKPVCLDCYHAFYKKPKY